MKKTRNIRLQPKLLLGLVVMAAVPMRTPLVWKGERLSPGTQFLFSVIPHRSSASCT